MMPNEPAPQEAPVLEHVPLFFSSLWTSIVRTFVPQIVGLVVAILAKVGLDIDNDLIVLAVTELFAVAYYVVIRGLEEFKDSKYGKALGRQARPLYFDHRGS